jgi:hypothetical protein
MSAAQTPLTTPEPGRPCRQDLDTLSAFFDNELDSRRRLLVQLHVAGCRRCTMVLCAFGEIRQRLRRMGSRPLFDDTTATPSSRGSDPSRRRATND